MNKSIVTAILLLFVASFSSNSSASETESISPEKALWNAVRKNNVAGVQKALQLGSKENDLLLKSKGGAKAFYRAGARGYYEIVKLLLEHGIDPNIEIGFDTALLPIVAKNGHIEIVKLLLKQGAHPDSKNYGKTAMIHAAWRGDIKMCQLLLKHGANVDGAENMTSLKNRTPLMAAANKGHTELVKVLLTHGANVNAKQKHYNNTALSEALKNRHREITKILLEHGATFNDSALLLVTYNNWPEIVRLLLEDGADANIIQKYTNMTPLIESSSRGYFEIVEMLLKYGASIDAQNSRKLTALMMATKAGYAEITRLLLERKANPNFQDQNGLTALMLASQKGHLEIVQALLKNGADISIATKSTHPPKFTALMYAVNGLYYEIAKSLLAHGANINFQDVDDESVLIKFLRNAIRDESITDKKGKPFLFLDYLLDKNVDVNIRSSKGYTALMVVAMINPSEWYSYKSKVEVLKIEQAFADITKVLIEHNADISLRNLKGESALDLARKRKHLYIVELLEWQNNQDKKPLDNLLIGAVYNDLKLVQASLKNGSNVNTRYSRETWKGDTPLLIAVDRGHIEIVKFLIDQNADINAIFEDGATALILGSEKGHKEIVANLLKKGANVSAQNKSGITALLSASMKGHFDIVKDLVKHGADVNITWPEGKHKDYTPLMFAASSGDNHAVKILLEAGADPDAEISHGYQLGTNALTLAKDNKHEEIVQVLKQKGVEETSDETLKATASLMQAIQDDDIDAVKQALENGAHVNARIDEDHPPASLRTAIQKGNKDIVQLLLQYGAKLHTKRDTVELSLIEAAAKGDIDTINSLIEKGSNVNVSNKQGESALMWASIGGYDDIVSLLLENGANVNWKNTIGQTPLIWAVFGGKKTIVKLLIKHEANIDAKPEIDLKTASDSALTLAWDQEHTALTLAAERGHTEITRLLLKAGGDVNITTSVGNRTALIAASINGYTDIVRMLLKHNADVYVSHTLRFTAATEAACEGHADIVELFDKTAFNQEDAIVCAAEAGYANVVEILLNKGLNVNERSFKLGFRGHQTALMRAAAAGNIYMVKLLLERGADKNDESGPFLLYPGGEKAIDFAFKKGHDDIVKLLLEENVNVKTPYADELEILDPACESTSTCEGKYLQEKVTKHLHGNKMESVSVVDVQKEKIPEMTVTRTGIVTDGITRLVLRVKTNQPVKFVLKPPDNLKSDRSSKYPWGALSEYNREREHSESIQIEHDEGEDYTYALYRSPSNFPLKSLKKPVYITIKAIAKITGEELEKNIQLFPPPVVLVHGLWSSKRKWRENDSIGVTLKLPSFQESLEMIGFEVYLVNYELKARATSTFNPQSASYSIGQLIAETNGALSNYRNKNIAITQIDVVAHSMGGLIARARTAYKHIKFIKLANYNRGDFHKIITIGTPHQGSPIANVLVECKDATAINCKMTYRDTECLKNCRDSCKTVTCESECQKGCVEEIICARDGWLKLSELLESEFYNPIPLMDNKEPMPIGEAVHDIQVGSNAIRLIPETKIPSHAIVGRNPKIMNRTDEIASNIQFFWFDIFFKSDKSPVTIDKLLGSSKYHDTIVSENSQKGGLLKNGVKNQVTIVENVVHTDEPLSYDVRKNTVRLLLVEEIELSDKNLLPIETKTFGFFKHFHAKINQLTTCDELPKKIKREKFVSKASISVEPLSGTVVKPGKKVGIQFDITDGTVQKSAVFNIGGNLIHLKGNPPYQIEYDVPTDKAGRLNINGITLGDSEESYSFKSYVIITPEGSPLSISSLENKIVLKQVGATYQLMIIGKYQNGSEIDITANSAGTSHTTKSGTQNIITVSADGFIEARGKGADSIIITNSGQSVEVMVHVGKPPSQKQTKTDKIARYSKDFSGKWVGTYNCGQAIIGLTLNISTTSSNLSAIYNFYPTQQNPMIKSGSFSLTGQFSEDGSFNLQPKAWLKRPERYVMVGMSGKINDDFTKLEGSISYSMCSSFELHKE